MRKYILIAFLLLTVGVLAKEGYYPVFKNKAFAQRTSKYDTMTVVGTSNKSIAVGDAEYVAYQVGVTGSDSVAVFVYTQCNIDGTWMTFHTDSLVVTSSSTVHGKGVVLRNLESATEVNNIKGAGDIRITTKTNAGSGADSTGTFSINLQVK